MIPPFGAVTQRRSEVAEAVARELVSLDHRADASFVQTPLMFPSGSYVVVRLEGGPEQFLVSDFGMGYNEADLMGAGSYFSRHARAVAENAGVGFDEHAFFVLNVSRPQLSGAIASIANCSHDAVAISAYKLADKARSDAGDRVFSRLAEIFPKNTLVQDAEIFGSSNHKWHVATLVTIDRRRAIFDPVTPHHTSVFSASAKFHDIANLDEAPTRVAMVQSKNAFNTYLGILTQAANVVELRATDESIMRAAKVA